MSRAGKRSDATDVDTKGRAIWGREPFLGDGVEELAGAQAEPGRDADLEPPLEHNDAILGEVDEDLGAKAALEDGVEAHAGEAEEEGVAVRPRRWIVEERAEVGLHEPVGGQQGCAVSRDESESGRTRDGELGQLLVRRGRRRGLLRGGGRRQEA